MNQNLDIIHPVAKFLSISRSVKLGNALPASKIQWWDKPKIIVI